MAKYQFRQLLTNVWVLYADGEKTDISIKSYIGMRWHVLRDKMILEYLGSRFAAEQMAIVHYKRSQPL